MAKTAPFWQQKTYMQRNILLEERFCCDRNVGIDFVWFIFEEFVQQISGKPMQNGSLGHSEGKQDPNRFGEEKNSSKPQNPCWNQLYSDLHGDFANAEWNRVPVE